MTLLSQHTSDVNTARAFSSLKERFPSWDRARSAKVAEIADSIRSGGLADQKAARMKQILTEIEEREGTLDLARLNSLSDKEVTDYLCSFSGVGPKTAACVLVFSMGRAAFPIDTHVHRVVLRLGWLPVRSTADQAHRTLTPRVPEDIRYELHMAMIAHGRTVCTARRPACSDCVLFDLCPAGPRLLAAGDAV
jgi:endonuclease III